MQQHVRKPLRLLRHDNYATFADIYTTALLQAAATGETLLDSDHSKSARTLQKLADKDASKIFRLNQRMQVGCMALLCLNASSLMHELIATVHCTCTSGTAALWFQPLLATMHVKPLSTSCLLLPLSCLLLSTRHGRWRGRSAN